MGRNKKILITLAILWSALGLADATPLPGQTVQKIIHEAENLSLNKDRALACGVLWRNIKKANKSDGAILKEKLVQLSRIFYTEKGFQSYMTGKDLFEKQKYYDAGEKLAEADELESSNLDILHLLTLAQLWQHKPALAEATIKRALELFPTDAEVLKDRLALLIQEENWALAITLADQLLRDGADSTVQTAFNKALSLLKSDEKIPAENLLQSVVQKDSKFPESYYWLATLKKDLPQQTKLFSKYVELCKGKVISPYDREVSFCTHLPEAEKAVTP